MEERKTERKPPSRWIVTGGSGFLGTNFLASSKPEDGEIVVIDRYAPRWPVVRPWIRYIEQDAREVEAYRELLAPDSVVLHMASASYPGKAEKAIESDIQDNVIGTIRLAQSAAEARARSFVFLSSGGTVYGNKTELPIKEDAAPDPISVYGAMKISIEHYLKVLHHLTGLPVANMRLANPCGKWHTGQGQGAINVFMRKILQGEAIEIWGAGEQVRDYIPADEAVLALRLAGLSITNGCEAFNIGTGVGRSLKDVLETLEKVTGIKPKTEYKPGRRVDVSANVLDSSKAKEILGWAPVRSFDGALAEYWEWHKNGGSYAP